jgi:hypothetical protein
MKIIAIQGFIGSGKDTFASLILENEKSHGRNAIKLSFASALKDCISSIFGWNRELLEGDTNESREWREQIDEWWSQKLNIQNLTPRWVLQNIGTNVMRGHFHPEIWLFSVEKQILNLKEFTDTIVITDCRFKNEIDFLRNMNAIFVKIQRGAKPEWVENYIDNDVEPIDIHPSEYQWLNNKFDFTIDNNAGFEELKEKSNEFSNDILNF